MEDLYFAMRSRVALLFCLAFVEYHAANEDSEFD